MKLLLTDLTSRSLNFYTSTQTGRFICRYGRDAMYKRICDNT